MGDGWKLPHLGRDRIQAEQALSWVVLPDRRDDMHVVTPADRVRDVRALQVQVDNADVVELERGPGLGCLAVVAGADQDVEGVL